MLGRPTRVGVPASAFLIQRDHFDDKSNDLLAVRGSCRRGVQKLWQVFTERQYLLSIALRARDRLLATPSIVFVFDLVQPNKVARSARRYCNSVLSW